MNPKVKICGMRDSANLARVISLKPDYIGMIFYPPSPRFVSEPEKLIPILKAARQYKLIGVFVNETIEGINRIHKILSLDGIQLHGNETPGFCRQCQDKGFFVIKAIGVSTISDFDKLSIYEEVIDLFLFDSISSQQGGSGKKFDWDLLSAYKGCVPFLLSGGIGKNDKISISHPAFMGVDLNSLFETKPGFKDIDSIKYFLTNFSHV